MQLPNQSSAITLGGDSRLWSPIVPGVTLSKGGCGSGEHRCSCPNGQEICCPDICRCACSSTQGFPYCADCA